MLNRPHTEFVQAQRLPWRRVPPGAARPDAEYKYLSRDPEDGACTCLIRYSAGWAREADESLGAAEEFYVLEGSLEIDGQVFAADHYGYVPAHWPRHRMRSATGAVVLTFFDARPEFSRAGEQPRADEEPLRLDVLHQAWDMSLNDPKLAHLGISRKNLRSGADGSRSFLSMILPHSEPPGSRGPRESHPVVEECYVLSGALVGPHGDMQAGAYFWRPPAIPHGPFGTRWGCVALIRFVGGVHANIWSPDEAAFDFNAPYRPVLPPELTALADLPPHDQAPRY